MALLLGPFVSVPSVPKLMTTAYDERELVAEVQRGSREAFDRLLDAYESKVYNLAWRLVGSQDAEDAAQDALVEICRSIASFQGRSSLSTWVYRVATNVCLEHRRRRRPEMAPLDEGFAEQQADPGKDPADAVMRNDVTSRVDSAVGSLPDLYRDVVVLHELQGLTYRECASVLGCPVGTVKSRLSNAFVKLRRLLNDYAYESGIVR